MSYVSADYDPDVLEKETREKINQYLKERDKKGELNVVVNFWFSVMFTMYHWNDNSRVEW